MDSLVKDFFSSFFAGFIFLMVLFANPVSAMVLQERELAATPIFFADVADALDPAAAPLLGAQDTSPASTTPTTSLANTPATSSTQTCAVSRLSPTEAKDIMNLTHEGFNGKQITDGADTNNSSVKKLDNAELVGKDLDGKQAVKVEAPNVAAPADRFSFFSGTKINGPFGIGLILDDTLRVGRCDGLDQTACKIFGQGLFTRTSGVGFKSDFVSAFNSVKGTESNATTVGSAQAAGSSLIPASAATDPAASGASSKSVAEANLTKEELEKAKANYLDYTDNNDFLTGSFAEGKMIKNSIYVNSYAARNATTCNNSACTISTYSAFDKYFNAWMTTDMFAFTVGPTLLHKANKVITKALKSSIASPLDSRLARLLKIREGFTGIPANLSSRFLAGEPSKIVGQARAARFKALIQEEGFAEIFDPILIKPNLWSSGAGGEIDKLTGPNSPIWKFSPEKKQKFFEAVEHLSAYARANATAVSAAADNYAAAKGLANALPAGPAREAALDAAKLEYGRKMALYLDDWDEILALDFEKWAKANEDLFSFGGLAVRKGGDYPEAQGYVDISTGAPFNLKRIVQKFRDDGDWSAWAGTKDAGAFQTAPIRDAAGNITGYSNAIQLYKIEPHEIIAENVSLSDLKFHTAKVGSGTYSVKLPDGRFLPLNSSTIDYIAANPLMPGHVNIYKAGYNPAEPLTPLDLANRLSDPRLASRPKTATRNMDDLRNALVQNDYAGRKSYSLLDKAYADEGDMISKYYKNPQVGLVKGGALPLAYWGAKQGFGQEQYSAFMLPDTWTTMTVSQGTDKVYKDSFIDFFANEGSDQGDMFKRAFQSTFFVWNRAIELAAKPIPILNDALSKYSGGFFGSAGPRDTVKDLAFYSHNENCAGCTGTLNYSNEYLSLEGFQSGVNMQAFLLEATDEATKKETGTAIISYTHHSDISGKTSQIEGEGINLSEAYRKGETCDQKLKSLGFGGFFSWAGTGTGGALALIENGAYFFGVGPGLIASFFQQMYFARELQDCVDDKEGYYIHFFAPAPKDAAKTKSKEILSNETVSSTLADMSSKLDGVVKEKTAAKTDSATPGNPIENSMDKLKAQFTQLADKAKSSNILQASLTLLPNTQGTVMGKDVFYIWFKDSLMPIGYRTNGQTVTKDGNISVAINYEDGTLKINGETVLGPDKADHVRMIAQDNRVPAQIVPMTLNKAAIPMDASTVFELTGSGEIFVRNQQVLSCIQKAIFDQTGLEFSQNELTQAFGELKSMSTDVYGSVFAKSGRIYLEGKGPRVEGNASTKFIVDGYMNTKLMLDANGIASGKFVGMTFEHGSIVLKKETNELIIWIRQHKDAVLSTKDVKGLLAKPTTVVDPETECTQPALDLEAVPNANDDLGAKRVDNFNTSISHLGPFTQFTTDKKIYEFYSKRDETTGECKNFFRVRDKETGKILSDSEIQGGIKVGDDGSIMFTTADGKQHKLTFDAENGVPTLSYNGGAPETLLSAQGPNGSFWFDPEKGLWYPENGLQIPLNQAFKDNGSWFAPDKNGNIVGTPENKMTFNIGDKAAGGFSIPSMPETVAGISVFVIAFLLVSFVLTQGRVKFKKNKVA